MLGQRRSPLLVQCRSIVYDAGSAANQCCFNVDPTYLAMAQQQPSIHYTKAYFAAQHCGNCYAADTFIPRGQKGHYPDWPNYEILLGHRLRRWANITPTKTLWALNHKYNREYYFFLNTRNVILHMFIRTGVQKCEPFSTNSTPISPK